VLTTAARLVAQIRGPLHSADPDRWSGVPLMIVDFQAPDRLRRLLRGFDAKLLGEGQDFRRIAGNAGHLAMTIDQGSDMSRYQGMVALEGGSLEDAAHEYFLTLGTDFQPGCGLRVGEEMARRRRPQDNRWRAGRNAAAISPRKRRSGARPGPIFIRAMRRRGSVTHTVAEGRRPGSKASR